GTVSWDTTGYPDGRYDVRAIATDNAGNVGDPSPTVSVNVDNTPPALSNVVAGVGNTVSGTATLMADVVDGGAGVDYGGGGHAPTFSVAGAHVQPTLVAAGGGHLTGSWITGAENDGVYQLAVSATDLVGNVRSLTVPVRVDNHPPDAPAAP